MTTVDGALTVFWVQLRALLRSLSSPFLIWFVVTGNVLMFSVAGLFYWFEVSHNPTVSHFTDAIWWGFTTVTTVGYGDIVPVTSAGRLLGILLMVVGAVFFVGFTAIFVSALVALHADYLTEKEEEVSMREYRNLLRVLERIEDRIAALERNSAP